MGSLELDRCEHTQRRVTPLAIVEDLQILERLGSYQRRCRE
jgi:hypothetical protein